VGKGERGLLLILKVRGNFPRQLLDKREGCNDLVASERWKFKIKRVVDKGIIKGEFEIKAKGREAYGRKPVVS